MDSAGGPKTCKDAGADGDATSKAHVSPEGVRAVDIERAIRAFAANPRPVHLRCGVQHYGWGDRSFIPRLLGEPTPASEPQAELWIGDHPNLPSVADLDGVPVPLDRLIDARPEAVLGHATLQRYGAQLPFLFKVLSAAAPLSIQAHPNRTQAVVGFARESDAGIPLTDPRRNYRDPNHKPELLVALTDFHALRGFRPLADIDRELQRHPSLAGLRASLGGCRRGLEALYAIFMRLPQAEVDRLLAPVVADCATRATDPRNPEAERCAWLLRADALHGGDDHHDRGLLSFLLLNLLHLRPAEAIYLPAGELHSYLEGAGLELMANSNNVLRGGLTSKHIDVDALLSVLSVDPNSAQVMRPAPDARDPDTTRYDPPAEEFALRVLSLRPAPALRTWHGGPALGLVLEGSGLEVTAAGKTLGLARGDAFLIPSATQTRLSSDLGARLALAMVGAAS
jgi:mannose-6-phosphate isomerase